MLFRGSCDDESKVYDPLITRSYTKTSRDQSFRKGSSQVGLRTNVRTLENWEQGRAKPNAQAALLINLVKPKHLLFFRERFSLSLTELGVR